MLGRAIKVLIITLGALLIVYPAAEYAREATKVLRYLDSGQLLSDVQMQAPDAPLVFAGVDTLDFIARPHPSVGGTLVAVIDSAGAEHPASDWLTRPQSIGTRSRLVFGRTDRDTTTFVLRAPGRETPWLLGSIDVLRLLIHVGYLLVGF